MKMIQKIKREFMNIKRMGGKSLWYKSRYKLGDTKARILWQKMEEEYYENIDASGREQILIENYHFIGSITNFVG